MVSKRSPIDEAANSTEIDVECPHCAHQTKKLIGWLRKQREMTCSACSKAFAIDATQLEAALRNAKRQLRDFERQISKTINIKLKL